MSGKRDLLLLPAEAPFARSAPASALKMRIAGFDVAATPVPMYESTTAWAASSCGGATWPERRRAYQVARLPAAHPRPRIVQTWWIHCWPPALMPAEARRGQQLGCRVHKVMAPPWQDPIEQAAAICEVVAKDFRVCFDANA